MHRNNFTLQFIEDIKSKILNGEYKVGQSIPPLRKLAQEYGYSRSVVNVGIARLESSGYLKIHNRQKIVVNDFFYNGALETVRDMAFCENREYKEKAVVDILSARKLIEIESVKIAAGKHNLKELALMDEIITDEQKLVLAKVDNYIAIAANDYKFHNQIVKLSDNIVYITVMNAFKPTALKMTQEFYKKNTDLFEYYLQKHKLIFQAIKHKDAKKAQQLLLDILEHGEKAYRNYNL